jgi:hypothetical protein
MMFGHSVVSCTVRHEAFSVIRSNTEAEANDYAREAASYAIRSMRYPRSLADLPHRHAVEEWEVNGVRRPMIEGLDDQTVADEKNFEYFGEGLTSTCQPGIVILASKDILDDGSHLLETDDDQVFWVGPHGFTEIRSRLEKHVPVSEWK